MPFSPDQEPKRDAACPHMGTCPMFAIFSYAGTLGAWKARYCTADYGCCARYEAAAQGRHIPVNLMPNGSLLRKAAG